MRETGGFKLASTITLALQANRLNFIKKETLALIFKYSFVYILLLMTFISISISLKTSNILENKSQLFEINDCTITVHNDFYYNEHVI